jgi:MFS family permease
VRLLVGISIAWIPLAFLSDGVTVLLLPARLAGAGGGASEIGLLSFAGLGVAVLTQPLAGRMSDRLRARVDRRQFMGVAAIPAVVGLWLLVGPTALPIAMLGYVLLQVAASALQAAQQTLIPELVGRELRGRAAGLKSAFDVGGAFLAFLLIGALLANGETISAGVMISVLVAASLLAVARLVPPTEGRSPSRGPGVLAVPPGFVRLVAARLLFLFGVYAVGRFMLLLVAERLGIAADRAADETGGVLALFALLTALAAVPAGVLADRLGRTPLMLGGAALAAFGIFSFVLPAGLFGVVAAGLLLSMGTAAFIGANWAATSDLAPAHDAGRLMGLANLGTGGAAALAGLLGPMIDVAGFTPALCVAGAVTLASALPLVSIPRVAPANEPA